MLLANGPTPVRRLRVDARPLQRVACPLAAHPGQEEAAAAFQLSRAEPLRPAQNQSVKPFDGRSPPVEAVTIAPAPTRAPAAQTPQHMQALARANRVRLARAELKRSIGRGEVNVAEVIEDRPWETESMTLAELLTSQRRWGRTRARKLLQALALSENKRLGTLTPRQRTLLTSALSPLARDTVLA